MDVHVLVNNIVDVVILLLFHTNELEQATHENSVVMDWNIMEEWLILFIAHMKTFSGL